MKLLYLDYAATTPLSKRVLKKMRKSFSVFGNPSSLHRYGQEAFSLLEKCREDIASEVNSQNEGITFCASATECSNFLIHSVVEEYKKRHNHIPHIIISDLEHDAVYETVQSLVSKNRIELSIIPSKDGVVKSNDIEKALTPHTALVAVIAVQNEIGTIQPIHDIYNLIKERRKNNMFPVFYTDAVQWIGLYDPRTIPADVYCFSSHKIYGPKGVGVLVSKNTIPLHPYILGGGQEKGVRAGTENLSAIIGCCEALKETGEKRVKEYKRLKELQEYLSGELKKIGVHIWAEISPKSPHITSITHRSFPDHIAHALDMKGIAVSSGSACSQRAQKKSRIIGVLGAKKEEIEKTIRISMGRETRKHDVDRLIKTLIMMISK